MSSHKFDVINFNETIKKPKNYISHNNVKVNEQNCLTFSYTSGTTGPPKGAMLSHGNFLAFLSAFEDHEINGFRPEDVYVSFLPLPHVFERVVMACIIYSGSFVAYLCTYLAFTTEIF